MRKISFTMNSGAQKNKYANRNRKYRNLLSKHKAKAKNGTEFSRKYLGLGGGPKP